MLPSPTSNEPTTMPALTCVSGRLKTVAMTRRGLAPTATRTPISRVRLETVNDSTA